MFGFLKLRSFRPPDQQPDRLACNWLLLSAALSVCLHLHILPLWLTAIAFGFLFWRLIIENFALRVPGRAIRWLLLLLTVVLVFRHYGTLLGRDAGVAYLTLLVSLKILEIRSLRDYLLVVFLIFLVVLGAFLFSQTMVTAMYSMLVVIVTLHALVRLNSPYPLRQRQTALVVIVLVMQALPLLMVMYLLFPRIQGSLWSLPVDSHSGRTGMSDSVSPGSINQLYEDDTIAFRAEFEGNPPPSELLYWRIFVLSETDGRQWLRHKGPSDGSRALTHIARSEPIRYTVLLEPHGQKWIPSLELVSSRAPYTHRADGYILRSNRPVDNLKRYNLSSNLSYVTPPLSDQQIRHNSFWSREPSQRVKDLVLNWQVRGQEPRDIVRQGLDLFAQDPFRYTLTPPLLTGDTLDEFLFESRAGYCEHYASAFAALMRLSGIPARLVVGYQGGEWNEAGDYMIVRQSDAHAWTEVWLHPDGWVRVDPTAFIAPERIELGADALRRLEAQGAGIGLLSINEARKMIAPGLGRRLWSELSMRWDNINNSWNKWVMAYGPSAQLELLRLVGFRNPDWINVVAGMVLSIMVLMLITAIVLMLRSRQKVDPAARLYQRFCKKLQKAGFERDPSEGPADYARRIIRAREDLREEVNRITQTYITLRYGRQNIAAIPMLRKQVQAFKVS